jgi:hypothetical protein
LWLLISLPVFAVVFGLLWSHPFWAILIVWWLKPLYERLPLKFLSTAVFGDVPGFARAAREGRSALRPGMLAALTFRRFSTMRSFEAPVYVLEGIDSKRRARRVGVLQPKAGSAALWLTLLGVHLESFFYSALFVLAVLFIPTGVEVDWLSLLTESDQGGFEWLSNVAVLLVMALVAPFYVASGFALYLNRRIELEAWDIELGFRRLAGRLKNVATVCVLVLLLPGGDALALEAPGEPEVVVPEQHDFELAEDHLSPRRRESRLAITGVLAESEFHQQTTLRYPKFLDGLFADEDEAQPDPVDLDWLAGVVAVLAKVIEVALWVLVIGALLWLAVRTRIFETVLARTTRKRRPSRIRGMEVSAESLPADVGAQAFRLWDSGLEREALSLVYRATLSRLMIAFDCPFRESDTEGDCLTCARSHVPPAITSFFAELTRLWVRAAYAHHLPTEEAFRNVCTGWSRLLEEPDG